VVVVPPPSSIFWIGLKVETSVFFATGLLSFAVTVEIADTNAEDLFSAFFELEVFVDETFALFFSCRNRFTSSFSLLVSFV
jgi:hypothetical protein